MTKGFLSTSLLKFFFWGEQELLKYPEIYGTVLFHFDNHHVKVDDFCHHFRNSSVSPVVVAVASFSRSLHHQRCKAKNLRPEIAILEVAGRGGGGGGGIFV